MIYRLHFTCKVGHTSYTDYKTMRSAKCNYVLLSDPDEWYATHIERVVGQDWIRQNGMWVRVTVTRPHKLQKDNIK